MNSKMSFKMLNFVLTILICNYLSIGHCAYSDSGNLDEIVVSTDLPPQPISYLHYCSSLDSTQKLSQNYEQILVWGNFSDVRLVVGKEKEEFRLHKSILYSRCPVIGEMFNSENLLEFPDESPEVFGQFIRFLYVGRVEKIYQYAKELLILADKFQMDCLKFLCVQHLSILSSHSVTSTLVFADLYKVAELKAKSINFITDHVHEVMASEDWKQLKDKPDLLLELLDHLVVKYVATPKLVEKVEPEGPRRGWWGTQGK